MRRPHTWSALSMATYKALDGAGSLTMASTSSVRRSGSSARPMVGQDLHGDRVLRLAPPHALLLDEPVGAGFIQREPAHQIALGTLHQEVSSLPPVCERQVDVHL